MAKRNMVTTVQGHNYKQILAFTNIFASVGIELNDAGVEEVNGKKIIKAGSPVGGSTDALQDETAVLSLITAASAEDVQGVLLHNVDVTEGENNGAMLIFGFVNEFRLDEDVNIPEAVKEELDGKVTFLRRNDMR